MKEIAKKAGFYGAFIDGQLVPIDKLPDDYKVFRGIFYGDWIYQEEDGTLSVYEKRKYCEEHKNDKKYSDKGITLKVFGSGFGGGAYDTGSYWKRTPLEAIAEAGAVYIRNSALIETDKFPERLVEAADVLRDTLFVSLFEDNHFRRYEFDFDTNRKDARIVTERELQRLRDRYPEYFDLFYFSKDGLMIGFVGMGPFEKANLRPFSPKAKSIFGQPIVSGKKHIANFPGKTVQFFQENEKTSVVDAIKAGLLDENQVVLPIDFDPGMAEMVKNELPDSPILNTLKNLMHNENDYKNDKSGAVKKAQEWLKKNRELLKGKQLAIISHHFDLDSILVAWVLTHPDAGEDLFKRAADIDLAWIEMTAEAKGQIPPLSPSRKGEIKNLELIIKEINLRIDGVREGKGTLQKLLDDMDDLLQAGSKIENKNPSKTPGPMSSKEIIQTGEKKTGGIDFNAKNMNVETKGSSGIEYNLPPEWQGIDLNSIQGLVPIIINITPVTNFYKLMGLNEKEDGKKIESSKQEMENVGEVSVLD
ncbi:MAG: hypothetical protein NT079_01180, partial [Candidatus Omnitrophica bacterium]|nr:hypothetical protein [Candidatus Omnitrophota bacterium]